MVLPNPGWSPINAPLVSKRDSRNATAISWYGYSGNGVFNLLLTSSKIFKPELVSKSSSEVA